MACNYCYKVFSIFRLEKRCPSCGFSYCLRCLNNTILVKKLKLERKVCIKCLHYNSSGDVHMIPPPDYYRKIGEDKNKTCNSNFWKKFRSNKINPDVNQPKQQKQTIRNTNVSNENQATTDENSPSTSDGHPRSNVPGTVSDKESKAAEGDVSDDFSEESQDENDGDVLNIRKHLKVCFFNKHPHFRDSPKKVKQDNRPCDEILKDVIKTLQDGLRDKADILETLHNKPPTCTLCKANAVVNCKGCLCIFCMRCFDMHSDEVCVEYETIEPHVVNEF